MTTNAIQVLGVGSPVVDLLCRVDEAALSRVGGAKGGMELIDSAALHAILGTLPGQPVRAPGGSAGNTTFALARLGLSCAFLGKLGADDAGAYYRDAFVRLGGDPSRFKQHPSAATAACLSLVTPDGERTMRTDLGAAMTMGPGDLAPADFSRVRHVHAEGYLLFNPPLLQAVLAAARAAGCTVSLDLGSFEVVRQSRAILDASLRDSVDIVFANEDEAEAFCGSPDPEAGLEALGKLCRVAAVKLGADGAWIREEGATPVRIPARSIRRLVDTTGAGDYWAAGFLYGFLTGQGVVRGGEFGALLGAKVVEQMGAALPEEAWAAVLAETGASPA